MIEISRRKLIKVGGVSLAGLLTSTACQTRTLKPEAKVAEPPPPPPPESGYPASPTPGAAAAASPTPGPDPLAGHDWKKYKIVRVADPTKMTLSERKHQPVIEIPNKITPGELFMAKINIGEVAHPMTPQHWIEWIEVYAEDQLLTRIEFTGFAPAAQVTVPLLTENGFQIHVLESCNQHGIWEAAHKIEV